MAETEKPKKRKPRGRPVERSDADLERISRVTKSDRERARAAVQAASPLLAALMDAKPAATKPVTEEGR
ncbi:MAG TPA: hypothetical protein PKD55_09665 [Bellilinea sp.]|nr:hypothetical protein [Bellilinea sp.]